MRKSFPVILIAALCLALVPIAFGHHGPVDTVIDEAAAKQPPVPFNHGEHATKLVEKCETCHHMNKGLTADSDSKVQNCAACHLDPKGSVPGMREMSLTKNPFHSLCMGCHKEQKKGPIACKDCHVK